ncbi:MAG: AAA family ATPase [Phycisphaerae bacterium]|nr:AAA family ATPase [Phycisphaerae bacterium]
MKLAISGKGGVGKTTFSAMLCGVLGLQDRRVIAVDADPDANLGSGLGIPADDPITPLAEMSEMITQRTGAADAYGGYFKLNPQVDDIPEKFARHIGSIRLLTLGGVAKGGGGCICPASALLKALLVHLVVGRDDTLIMDMEAGIEHLGRATAQCTDALVVVLDPGPWSLQTAGRVHKLAADIGIGKILAVVNRVTDNTDIAGIESQLGQLGIPLIGQIPFDPDLAMGPFRPSDKGELLPTPAFGRHRENIENILATAAKEMTKPQ